MSCQGTPVPVLLTTGTDLAFRLASPTIRILDVRAQRARSEKSAQSVKMGQNWHDLRRQKVKTPFEGLRGAQESKPVKFVGRQNPRGRLMGPAGSPVSAVSGQSTPRRDVCV